MRAEKNAFVSHNERYDFAICSGCLFTDLTLRSMSHLRFYHAILLHECATLSREKVADSATVRLHAATSSH